MRLLLQSEHSHTEPVCVFQDVREMVVKEEECKYVPYVQSLRQQIRQLQDQLGS